MPLMQLDNLERKARNPSKDELHSAMLASRERTIAGVQSYRDALGDELYVPCQTQLNLPRWEVGHIGWFYDWWISRNPDFALGLRANPSAKRKLARQVTRGIDADSLYNSSDVHHSSRWGLALPSIEETLKDLEEGVEETVEHLQRAGNNPESHYFFQLSVLHEDMHAEAAVYMAQSLGIPMGRQWQALVYGNQPKQQQTNPGLDTLRVTSNCPKQEPLRLERSQAWRLGFEGEGFAFDNECPSQWMQLEPFEIDPKPVSWGDFLAFINDDGYTRQELWTQEGWAWLEAQAYKNHPQARGATGQRLPRYIRYDSGEWLQEDFGQLKLLNADHAACHINYFEARAWCQWKNRRLPTEAQWEWAARQLSFSFGEVWEWTSSPFLPFCSITDFKCHPYQDYSYPWFDGRPVLKGYSLATPKNLRHRKFRNFFTPERNDIFVGFRSVKSLT